MECPSPIIVHRCLWEPKEQEQGIRGTTLRGASDCWCSRSWKSSGAVISAQHPRTPQGPTSPCAAAPARHVRLISSRYSKPILGGSPDPPPDTPSSHQSPNCRSNFQTVTCAKQAAAQDHLVGEPFVLQFSLALPLSPFLMQLSRNPLISIAPNEQSLLGLTVLLTVPPPPDNKPQDVAIKRPFDQLPFVCREVIWLIKLKDAFLAS